MISKVGGHLHDCSLASRGKIAIATALLIGTIAIPAPASAQDRPLQFALMGDTGYTSVGIEQFKRLLAAINRTELAFVVHVGDFQVDPRGWRTDPAHAKFLENLRWSLGGVTFATAHIVGSNDNFGRTPEMDAEHIERKAANIAWMKEAFARANTNAHKH
jgi:hypothetical protein